MEAKLKERRWNKEFEEDIRKAWEDNDAHKFHKISSKPVYSIDTPPPYVNSPIHIGHATTYSLMDMIARFRRMIGYEVLFPLGLDRNGLPIEMAAEKKFGKSCFEVSREEFLAMCNKVLEESSASSVDSFKKLGISFNNYNLGKELGDLYHTDSKDYRQLTQETFIDLYNKGLIYEDERINNYCPGCQTTIADSEIEYNDMPSKFNDIIFKVKETGEKIIIGTTRPELVCTCGMVIFHPDDDRYKHLDGKTAITPLFDKEVPIRAHPQAQIDKGTGIVMMCAAGDLSDIRFFREMKIEPVIAIDVDGRMNENAGFLKGLSVKDAREHMIEELKKNKLLVNQTSIVHRTPICERSKHPIEFIKMKEFYLKQMEFKNKMIELSDRINFFAESSRRIFLDWLDRISFDWPISRRRFYATEIPLWYHKESGKPLLPPKGRYYQPWKEKPPKSICDNPDDYVGETRVFDTWFDSSISPLYILKYERDKEFFAKNNRCSLRPQGKEIVRTWLYYTVLKCYLLTENPIFQDVWVHYHIIDESGNKMSKSKGNVIDPHQIIEKFGAEPFRLWTALEGNITTTDLRCSFDRIEGSGKTLTKLWNVARFISMFPKPKGCGKGKRSASDNWILGELNKLIEEARAGYERYDFHNPAIKIRHFIWEVFSSHYLELAKQRAYNEGNIFSNEEQSGALWTLYTVLDTILKLLAPIIPFITYKIYSSIKGKDIQLEDFPKRFDVEDVNFTTDDITNINSIIWKAKKDAGMSLKAEVSGVTITGNLKDVSEDLKRMHRIKDICVGDKVEVSL